MLGLSCLSLHGGPDIFQKLCSTASGFSFLCCVTGPSIYQKNMVCQNMDGIQCLQISDNLYFMQPCLFYLPPPSSFSPPPPFSPHVIKWLYIPCLNVMNFHGLFTVNACTVAYSNDLEVYIFYIQVATQYFIHNC